MHPHGGACGRYSEFEGDIGVHDGCSSDHRRINGSHDAAGPWRCAVSPRASTRLLGTQSDERLLELVAKGHERAFEALVHRYRRSLLGYCRRLGLSDTRAEDAVQQALLKAWLALQSGTEVRELRPWLFRIVHNTALNVLRSTPRERGMIEEEAGARGELSSAAPSELESRMAARDALRDVAGLPPMQRDAILLTAFEGRSHEEVASTLGITHGAVRGLLYRARATLRSAAAVLVPPPVLQWASGGVSRVAPTAARLGELSAGGGGEAGGLLAKGAAVAVTAALAAGAVFVPLHHHAAKPSQRATAGGGSAASGIRQEAATAPGAAPARAQGGSGGSGGQAAGGSGGHGSAPSASAGPVPELSASTGGQAGGGTGRRSGGGGSGTGSGGSAGSPVSGSPGPSGASVGRIAEASTATPPAAPISTAPGSGSTGAGTGGGTTGGEEGGTGGGESGSKEKGEDGESGDGGDGAEQSDDGEEETSGGSIAQEAEATHEREAEEARRRSEHEAEVKEEEAKRAQSATEGSKD